MSLSDEIAKLQELHRTGALSEAEFQAAKARLLAGDPPPSHDNPYASPAYNSDADLAARTNTWAMMIHLTQFAGYAVPLAGMIVPIVLWQIKKNELPGVDVHGRNVVNWILSELIFVVIGIILCFVFIGIPLLWALGILAIVFPIIGGVKAASGEVWRYPMSFQFF